MNKEASDIKKKISIESYNDLLQAKKNSALSLKLIVGFSLAVVIGVLMWAFSVYLSTLDKVKVIDQTGNILTSHLEDRSKLLKSIVENHCANTVYYLNSFDRLTIKEHQARALFLVNSGDAGAIFSQNKVNGNYSAALMRGVSFHTTYEKLLSLETDSEPYKVSFQSILSIHDNEKPVEQYLVESEGELIHHTAQYPENPVGLYFKKYTQEFKPLKNEK